MIGSMFSTLAMSTERYIAVVHPFVKYKHKYNTCHFATPVVIYSILYNFPKFLEFDLACVHNDNGTIILEEHNFSCDYVALKSAPMRENFWYLKVYGLLLNCVLNITIPLFLILLINIKVYRSLTDNLDYYQSVERRISIRIQQERFLRKREVHISMLNVYYVILSLLCHSLRIIPNIYEVTISLADGKMEEQPWPLWLDV